MTNILKRACSYKFWIEYIWSQEVKKNTSKLIRNASSNIIRCKNVGDGEIMTNLFNFDQIIQFTDLECSSSSIKSSKKARMLLILIFKLFDFRCIKKWSNKKKKSRVFQLFNFWERSDCFGKRFFSPHIIKRWTC